MTVPCKIKILLQAFACYVLFIFLSCRDKKSTPSQCQNLLFNQISHEICGADTSQSYKVYLPVAYSNQQTWPVIFVFDPHANASKAVAYFKEAAENFGYIIIGSDNSKNGIQTLDHTLTTLVNDVLVKFSIDDKRQYAAGFSGGGRVASYFAMKTGNIKGIITCGAGIPNFNPQRVKNKFDIYAIAGYEDFNYSEILALVQQLDATGWRFVTLGFNGGHTWPSVNLLTNAVCWFQFNAMKDGIIPKDRQKLKQVLDSTFFRCNNYLDNNQYIMAFEECRRGTDYLDGLLNTNKLKKKLIEIEQMEEFQAEKQKEGKLLNEELRLQQGYLASLTSRDLIWWTKEIKLLNKQINLNNSDLAKKQMLSRVKGFLGIVCYSYTSNAINENNNVLAQKYIGIYEIVEPQNPDCLFFKALLLYRKNDPGEAANMLEKAIKLGYSDKKKIKALFPEKFLTGMLL